MSWQFSGAEISKRSTNTTGSKHGNWAQAEALWGGRCLQPEKGWEQSSVCPDGARRIPPDIFICYSFILHQQLSAQISGPQTTHCWSNQRQEQPGARNIPREVTTTRRSSQCSGLCWGRSRAAAQSPPPRSQPCSSGCTRGSWGGSSPPRELPGKPPLSRVMLRSWSFSSHLLPNYHIRPMQRGLHKTMCA